MKNMYKKSNQLREIATKIKKYIYSAADREKNIKIILEFENEIRQLINDENFNILIDELKSNKWIARRGIELISLIRAKLWKEYYKLKKEIDD